MHRRRYVYPGLLIFIYVLSLSITILFAQPKPLPVEREFFRAINFNGEPVQLDTLLFEGKTAPGVNISAARAKSAMTPAVDVVHPEMFQILHFFICGQEMQISLSEIPKGEYEVFIYTYEDNYPQVFSILLEDRIVERFYNTRRAGTWAKLGPYRIRIHDGELNVGSFGGDANFAAIEIHSIKDPYTPAGPTDFVVRALSDRSILLTWTDRADNEAEYHIFRGERSRHGFRYHATIGQDACQYIDSFLPSEKTYWYRVRSVNNAATSKLSENAQATTMQSIVESGLNIAWNFNGAAPNIKDQPWRGTDERTPELLNLLLSGRPGKSTISRINPPTDSTFADILRSYLWGEDIQINYKIHNGIYNVYLYTWEDDKPENFSVIINDIVRSPFVRGGDKGTWQRLGPYTTTIFDGSLRIHVKGGWANISAMEIFNITFDSSQTGSMK